MLRFMRRYATGYLVKGLFGIIIVVFIFWGVGSFRGGEKVVAEVGSHKITIVEYQESYNRLFNFYKMIYKDRFDDTVVNQLKIKEKAMDELVDKYVLLTKAKEMGLGVSERDFSEYIANIDAFKRDGKFNQNVYAEILKRNNIDPKEFERSEKARLLTSKLINIINDNSVFVSDSDVWTSYTEVKGEINLSYVSFDPASFKDRVSVNDKEVEDVYEKEKDRHKSENVYRLKYIVIDEKSSIKDDAAYLDLLKTKDIAEYAKQKGFDVLDVGAMKESELVRRFKGLKIQEWLKGLKKGDISLPVRDAGRSYIFQLVDAEGGKPIDKNVVLKEIKERVVMEKAKEIAKTEAEAEISKKIVNAKKDTGLIPRNSASIPKIGALPPEHAGVLALTKAKGLYEKPVDISGIYYVFTYKGEKQPSKEEWEKDKKSYTQHIFLKKREEYYKGLIEELRKKQKIEIHWKEI